MKQQLLTLTENTRIAENVYRMTLESPALEEMKPGQFVNIRLEGQFLRRPSSVYDSRPGKLAIIYKAVGRGTEQMSRMTAGGTLDVLTGLGNGYDLSKAGEAPLLLGGGVGVPPLYMLARKLREQGKKVSVVLGFNTKSEVFGEYEKETGNVIVERFKGMNPDDTPAVLVRNHGPFAWGKDADNAVHNAVVLEQVAKMASISVDLSTSEKLKTTYVPGFGPKMNKLLIEKHYSRKHGPNAYYGQKKK